MIYYADFGLFFWQVFAAILIFTAFISIITYILFALILYNTAKTNGLNQLAFLSWIPAANYFIFFALGSKKTTAEEINKDALVWIIVYLLITFLPTNILMFTSNTFALIICFFSLIIALLITIYYLYRLYYRWSGDIGKAILYVFLTFITISIFFYIYGLIKMKKPFTAI